MKTFLSIVVLAILGVTGTWLVQSPASSDAVAIADRETLPVSTLVLKPVTSVTRERLYSGTIVAARRSLLAFQRSARLQQVLFDEGDTVNEGDELAEIDQRQLLTQVTQLEAQISQQKAILAELTAGPRQETIAAMRAELAALSADVELRKATLGRTEELYQRKGASAQSLDESRLAWQSLVSKRESIGKQLEELEAGTRKERITAQQAMVSGLEAQLESLNVDVADSQLKAPFAGTIVRRLADEGDMLDAQQPVFELLETSRMEARIGVPSAMAGMLGAEEYHVLSVGNVEVNAKLRSVIAMVDAATRTQTAVFDIDESQVAQIADGQLTRLKFSEQVAVEGFEVPLTALAAGSRGLWTLYVVESVEGDHVVAGRAVEVLHTNGAFAVIRGPVSEGEVFVSDGVHKVVPGQKVVTSEVTQQPGGERAEVSESEGA